MLLICNLEEDLWKFMEFITLFSELILFISNISFSITIAAFLCFLVPALCLIFMCKFKAKSEAYSFEHSLYGHLKYLTSYYSDLLFIF